MPIMYCKMTDRQLMAHDFFKQGYNCAQATLKPFSDILPLDEPTLMRISSAFGGGFAKTRNICGAVSAIGMIVGLTYNDIHNDPEKDKAEVYKLTRGLTDKFTALNTSLLCGELLKNIRDITSDYRPTPRTQEYYNVRPCVKFVMDAVAILEDYLKNIGKI